ncbi:hypothetical protein TIFTF001_011886 [Ficus carica]|uniref:Uncharacterized protein n=1 Tax=Ficus carica TaxID=3494 RepID=A0AA87ZV02_FICCA|nr:hypothetical protein TIFTF001_011886 [Ficus carica]
MTPPMTRSSPSRTGSTSLTTTSSSRTPLRKRTSSRVPTNITPFDGPRRESPRNLSQILNLVGEENTMNFACCQRRKQI